MTEDRHTLRKLRRPPCPPLPAPSCPPPLPAVPPLAADDACVCDVASGDDGGVSVAFVDGAYSFSETELESQRLSVVPELVNGRRVTLHANYAPPPNFGHAAVELRGDGAECRRWLTGKLSLE